MHRVFAIVLALSPLLDVTLCTSWVDPPVLRVIV
jgi:hypothetical protein